MLDAVNEAIDFSNKKTRTDLDDDRMLVLALVKELEIIGEAAYKISETTRNQTPDIPWEIIIGMRHRLVHAYFDINLNILWRTLRDDLPSLKVILEAIISPKTSDESK